MHTLTSQEHADNGRPGALALVGVTAAAMVAAIVLGESVLAPGTGVGVGVATSVALMVATAGAIVDARTGRIPDRLVLTALAPIVGVVLAESARGHAMVVAVVIGGAAVYAVPLLMLHLAAPVALGFGDVKLAAALGAALGLVDVRLGLLALCVASGATALVGVLAGRRSLPLGPGLVLGAIAALVVAATTAGAAPVSWR